MDELTIEGLDVTAPMDSDAYLVLEPLVNDIASSEWKNSTAFSIDDVAQAIWVHMMENWEHYEGKDEALVRFMARRAARMYCQRERINYMYAIGAYLYTPALVRRYLRDVVWCSISDCPDVDARADVSEAYKHLRPSEKAVLFKQYALKEPLSGKEKAAASRAVTAMTQRLNTGLRMFPEGY